MADTREPSATLTDARETDDGRVIIESDASAAWRDWSISVVRRLTHLRPNVLIVEDICRWGWPTVTWQYWQSLGEWRQLSDGLWQTSHDGVELQLQIASDSPVTYSTGVHAVDGNLQPVYRLCASTAKQETARLLAIIQVRPSADIAWPIEPGSMSISTDAVAFQHAGHGQVNIDRKPAR